MIVCVLFISTLLLKSIQSNEYYEEEYYYNQNLSYYYDENNSTETKIDEPKIKIEENIVQPPEYIDKSSHLNILDDIFLPVLFNYCSYNCDKPNSNDYFELSFFGHLLKFNIKEKKLKNPKYIPKSNGCGSYGFNFDFETIHIKGFNECEYLFFKINFK